jgi:hypothetical protein
MPAAYKVRAMLRGLAKHGEPSSLAGVACGPVAIERNATLTPGIGDTADDNHVVRATIASIASRPEYVDEALGLAAGTTPLTYNPRVGQTLVHPDGTFRLDRLFEDNGIVRRFISVPA